MQTFLVASNACGRTFEEVSQRIHSYLLKNGLQPTVDVGKADLIVVDTCGFCQAAEDHSMGIVDYCLEHRHASAKVLVVGCLPGINRDRLDAITGLESLLPAELGQLDAITGASVPFESVRKDGADPRVVRPPSRGEERRAFHITTSTGCLHHCTFCAVKTVWGQLKSKPVEAIVRELEAAVAAGHELIYLAAQDLGAYGVDLGTDVVALLAALFEVDGDYKLILHDFNPQWLIKHARALEALFVEHLDKVAYLDVPLQSGSDRVLKRMKRPYSAGDVGRVLFSLKQAVPELIVEIDIMMGFPGETEEDFALSVAFLEEAMTLDSVSVWLAGYSERPHTAAAKMADPLAEDTVMERFLTLQRMVERGPSRLGTGLVYFEGYHL